MWPDGDSEETPSLPLGRRPEPPRGQLAASWPLPTHGPFVPACVTPQEMASVVTGFT